LFRPLLFFTGFLFIVFTPFNFFLWFIYWIVMFFLFRWIEQDILSPLWIFFFYFFAYFAIRPGYYLLIGEELLPFNTIIVNNNVYFITIIFTTIAMVSFLIGYSIKFSSNNIAYKKKITYSASFMVLLAIILELISIFSAIFLIQYFGGINQVLSLQSALVKLIPDSIFLVKLAWIFVLVSFIPLSLLLANYGFSKRVFLLLLVNMTFCLILGRRLAVLSLLVPFAIYYHYYLKRISVERGAFLFIGLLCLMVGIVSIRLTNSAFSGLSIIGDSAEFFVWDMVVANINAFNETITSRNMLDFIPYWIRNIFDLDWFSNYPSLGEALVSIHFPNFPAGIPPGLPGMFYMQFGFPSLIILCFFLGAISRKLHKRFLISLIDRVYILCIYSLIIIAYQYVLRTGDLWVSLNSYWRMFFFAFVIVFICRNVRFNKTKISN
jgi:oligosaccharide repeat unit polymerase